MSSIRITVPPLLDPVPLAEARAHCRVDANDEDPLLAGFIIGARQAIEDETGRALIERTMQITLDQGWPYDKQLQRNCIRLPCPPLVSVSSITYIDSNGSTQTLAADQYQVTKGDVFASIQPAYGVSWPSVRCQLDAITVTYVAGYGSNPGDVPEPLRQAIKLLIGHFHENREAVTVGNAIEMPLACSALAQFYKTYW